MLVIRLLRTGKRNQPFFKIVVTEKNSPPRGGRFVEELGFYNPLTKESSLEKERAQYWVSKGAQPSATIHNFLVKEGVLQSSKIPVQKKSKKAAPPAEKKKPEELKQEEKKLEALIEEKKPEEKKEEEPKEIKEAVPAESSVKPEEGK